MKMLLDTHTLLWSADNPGKLSPAAAAAINDPANELLVSAATVWEIAIKVSLGKLILSIPYRKWCETAVADLHLTLLPITVEYAERLSVLPFHHTDPFDRLIIAQARSRGSPSSARTLHSTLTASHGTGEPSADPSAETRGLREKPVGEEKGRFPREVWGCCPRFDFSGSLYRFELTLPCIAVGSPSLVCAAARVAAVQYAVGDLGSRQPPHVRSRLAGNGACQRNPSARGHSQINQPAGFRRWRMERRREEGMSGRR